MRGHTLGWTPSDAFLGALAANSKPPDIPPPPSGELEPSGGGRYKKDDDVFSAKIARDGTVHLRDKRDFDIHAVTLGDVVGSTHNDWLLRHLPVALYGRFEPDVWLERKAGEDPYASRKLAWLDKTRDERARIGMENRKEDLARAPEYMQLNVAWAWQKTEHDPEARKHALFELWDDCAESGDDALVEAGRQARAYLIGFIRDHLGADQPGAFTADDLARLNARRRSQAAFEPY
jgi:hypothetical protein